MAESKNPNKKSKETKSTVTVYGDMDGKELLLNAVI